MHVFEIRNPVYFTYRAFFPCSFLANEVAQAVLLFSTAAKALHYLFLMYEGVEE